jgi:hypothetical protein
MKKFYSLFLMLIFLTSCAETLALLGPASTSATGGKVAQSAASSVISYGIKKQTGKSPMEHALEYAEKRNPDNKKSKCVSFLEATNSEFCEIAKKNILETKKKIIEKSKIENLAKKSVIYNRR